MENCEIFISVDTSGHIFVQLIGTAARPYPSTQDDSKNANNTTRMMIMVQV
ncbi:hypothetical protein T02_4162 [Trichinella nativa]|uniref:Uncharacterized protein n=1 Tax=Trichinella nativa TaxID=6335 RepID=A0A0V1KQH0_9BILA|nr:hypothetical protein T02_4162 [Trichinella nativa]